MQTTKNIFKDKQVRSVWDDAHKKWWFSAADICAVLTNSDYETAREYWKKIKSRWAIDGNQLVAKCDRLKLKASDGKLRFVDVLDIRQVLYLIQIIHSKAAEPFRLWLADAAVEGTLVQQLEALGERNRGGTLEEMGVKDGGVVDRVTFVRREIEVQQ
ncbi:MAG: hypothetical protein FWD03_00675 [Defluviitaleaceae bacterium]|nr:hypothetical protein [Defluviitaleaceae bacterium]